MFKKNFGLKILTVSGSSRKDSTNVRLLEALPVLFPEQEIQRFDQLDELPLFTAQAQEAIVPTVVEHWKQALNQADALVISTPEYLYNLPALLKNALEWITESGELFEKRVLALSFGPHPPRGEKALQSLIWSLQALKTNIVVQLPLYVNETPFDENNQLLESDSTNLLREAFSLLTQ